VADVSNLVPLLAHLPEVDAGRIGMIGWSRGGMMTFLALAQQARQGTRAIKAAVTIGALSDLTELLEERPSLLDEVYRPLIGASPGQAPEAYRARSAVAWPELLDVPLLLLHGEDDARAPVRQSRRLADLVAAAGHPVRLVTFPGDDHALSAHASGLAETLGWLERHLGRPGEALGYASHRAAIAETLGAWPR